MSEFKKELLEPAVTKKQIIGVIIISIILVSMFTFSVYAWSLIFGTQRDEPSKELDKAEKEDVEPLEPYFPIDLDDLMDWLADNIDDLDLEDLDDLEDLGIDTSNLDQADLIALANLISEEDVNAFLEEMLDGSVDNYDLTMAGLAIAALLFSDVEAFRVYEYDNPTDEREDILWKYECFDQFNRDGWASTVPMEQTDFLTFEDYYNNYNIYDLIKLKRQISAIIGSNSFVLGSLFPTPYIIEDSIEAPNLDQTILFSDDFGCVSSNLIFNVAGDIDMIYKLFGEFLPTNEEINATAVSANYNPSDSDFQKFLQLPGGISGYINNPNNNDFRSHWNTLNTTISSQDNAFMVANKIRNYLQSNFDLSFDALVNDPPGEGEDVVEWFSEHGEGLYSEFASAFVVFARSFGLASRFVDGFNSRLIIEDYDPDPYYPIKYKNIYNWAEIYVPWDTTGLPGHGRWVQMDILYDSYGEGGSPVGQERFNISVLANYSDFNIFDRNDYVKLTAKLNSSEFSVDGRTVSFTDLTTDQELGTNITNSNGFTSILVHLNNTHRVGPHRIEGSVLRSKDETYYLINDEIRVILENISPAEVNVSETIHTIFVEGYAEDPINSQRIEDANVAFLLLYKGTNDPVNVPNSFNPMSTFTDSNGRFDITLDVADYNPYGEYDFRVDFNGSWIYAGPFPFINDSSDVMDLNITKELTYDIHFYINGTPTEYPYGPTLGNLIVAKRYNNINLTAIVLDADTKNKSPDIPVEFHDYTNGFIGAVVSGANGNATIIFNVGATLDAGPTLVYAKIGSITNYSYYIINESISIDAYSYDDPIIQNIAAAPQTFNIKCRLLDDSVNFIRYSQIELKMNRSSIDYSYLITPDTTVDPVAVGSFTFDFDRGVELFTPPNNYSLKLEFNGFFDFTSSPYIAQFNLNYLSNFTYLPTDIQVIDGNQIEIFLEVEGKPARDIYDNIYQPRNYTRGVGQEAHFQVRVVRAGGAISVTGNTTRIYDDYSNILLDSYTYDGSESPAGFIQFNISTNKFYHAGIHRIRVEFSNFPNINTTLIVINETVDILPDLIVNGDNEITRDIESFSVSGVVKENGTNLRGLVLRILLLDQNYQNMSTYLIGNLFAITDSNGYFQLDINRVDGSLIQGLYYIRIDFNGTIYLDGEVPRIDPIQNYMIHNSSYLIPINITAVTSLEGYYYTVAFPSGWYEGDTCYVVGNLTWDNSTRFSNVLVNVTIYNGTGSTSNTGFTNLQGEFNISFIVGVDWDDLTKIYVYFYPQDSIGFPDYFYIETSSKELFRII